MRWLIRALVAVVDALLLKVEEPAEHERTAKEAVRNMVFACGTALVTLIVPQLLCYLAQGQTNSHRSSGIR
jgi:hypothetical protein